MHLYWLLLFLTKFVSFSTFLHQNFFGNNFFLIIIESSWADGVKEIFVLISLYCFVSHQREVITSSFLTQLGQEGRLMACQRGRVAKGHGLHLPCPVQSSPGIWINYRWGQGWGKGSVRYKWPCSLCRWYLALGLSTERMGNSVYFGNTVSLGFP